MRESHRTFTLARHLQDNKSKATRYDDCKNRMDTKNKDITTTNNGKYIITIDQQQQHRRLRTDSSLSHRGLKGILLVPKQKHVKLAWRFPNYCNFFVSSWRSNQIKLTYYDETKKRPHGSQIVRVTENQVESWWALLQISIRPRLTRRLKLYVMFCCALLGVLSNFAIILKKKRELLALLFFSD